MNKPYRIAGKQPSYKDDEMKSVERKDPWYYNARKRGAAVLATVYISFWIAAIIHDMLYPATNSNQTSSVDAMTFLSIASIALTAIIYSVGQFLFPEDWQL